MKIVGATGLGRLVGVRVGMAYSQNTLAPYKATKSQFSIFDSFRDIRVHTYDFLKIVGGKVGVAKFLLGQSIGIDDNKKME